MRRLTDRLERVLRSVMGRLDAGFNTLYSWRYNPLYYTGQLVIAAFVALLVTGLFLLLYYRIGSPYGSVERITAQVWAGRWIRSLHRYASAAVAVAGFLHALRYFAQNRSWGPRTLAWISGIVLFGLFYLCAWTGYVMVWDTQAQVLAMEGARLMDFLPVFSEPIERAFVGEGVIPPAFFFLNLFAHIAVPVGIGLVLWVHLSRLARTYLMPPRPLLLATTAALLLVSVLWPMGMSPQADLLRLPVEMPFDVLYGFWLPLTRRLPAGWVWGMGAGLLTIAMAIPWITNPGEERGPGVAVVQERICTACEHCFVDCPYEAITMVPRSDGREGRVARVEPSKCTGCDICAASCAPMCIGVPDRDGRAQLARVRAFLRAHEAGPSDIVLISCARGAGAQATHEGLGGVLSYTVECAGSLHSSVIERFVKAGVGGVLVISCNPGDCWNREGVRWLQARVHEGREAELKARVDRRRVSLGHAGAGEVERVTALLGEFRAQVDRIEVAP